MRPSFAWLACGVGVVALFAACSKNDSRAQGDGSGSSSSVAGAAGENAMAGSSNATGGKSNGGGGDTSGTGAGGTNGGSGNDTGGAGGDATGGTGSETGGTGTGGTGTGGTGGTGTGGTGTGGGGTGTGGGATGDGVSQLAVGANHGCIIYGEGAVKCWGYNAFGQLGLGDTNNRGDTKNEVGPNLPAVDLGTGRHAKSIAAGENHTCAILDDDSVKCWGSNSDGQLGLGNLVHRGDNKDEMGDFLPAVNLGTGRKAVSLALGGRHSCALLDDATVKCWGFNGYGQLGIGNQLTRGDADNEMGDQLPAVKLGIERSVISLSSGKHHSCVLLDDASVKCWGFNGYAQLGLGDNVNRGVGTVDMGDNLDAVNLGSGRTAVALGLGEYHSCAFLDNGTAKCWGYNAFGQLGQSNTTTLGWSQSEMGNALPAIQVGTGRTIKSLHVGPSNGCAILDNDATKCWGRNQDGQLGRGNTEGYGDTENEMGDFLPPVALGTGLHATALGIGVSVICALLDDETVKCWGGAQYGQHGGNTLIRFGDQDGEMGDDLPRLLLP